MNQCVTDNHLNQMYHPVLGNQFIEMSRKTENNHTCLTYQN